MISGWVKFITQLNSDDLKLWRLLTPSHVGTWVRHFRFHFKMNSKRFSCHFNYPTKTLVLCEFFFLCVCFQEFDKKYNPTWHCIVGRNFGSYVTHETKHFIYFYLGQVAILLFKSGWKFFWELWGLFFFLPLNLNQKCTGGWRVPYTKNIP